MSTTPTHHKMVSHSSFGSGKSWSFMKRKASDDKVYFENKLAKTIGANKQQEERVAQLQKELEKYNSEFIRLHNLNYNLRQTLEQEKKRIVVMESSALLSQDLEKQLQELMRCMTNRESIR